MQNNDRNELEALRSQALSLGIDISAPHRATAILQRRQIARENARKLSEGDSVAKHGLYDLLERFIVGTGNLLTLVLMLVLANIMLPVGIIGLAMVEIQRVQAGIALFDTDHALLMAVVALSFYLVLLVVQAHMRLKQSGSLEKSVWSLKLWARGMYYKIGLGKQWQLRTTTPLQRLEATITAVGWVIIVLGTVGSMSAKLGTVSGAWFEALWSILTDSSLTDFLTYIGGFVFTAALLAATHWGVSYAYERYARLRPEINDSTDTTEAEDRAEVDYLRSLVFPKLEKQARPTAPASMPGLTGHLPSGSGNGHRVLVRDGE